jgi:hypothetical protein
VKEGGRLCVWCDVVWYDTVWYVGSKWRECLSFLSVLLLYRHRLGADVALVLARLAVMEG